MLMVMVFATCRTIVRTHQVSLDPFATTAIPVPSVMCFRLTVLAWDFRALMAMVMEFVMDKTPARVFKVHRVHLAMTASRIRATMRSIRIAIALDYHWIVSAFRVEVPFQAHRAMTVMVLLAMMFLGPTAFAQAS